VGTKSESWAITAQRRVNCQIEVRREEDRSKFVLTGRPGLTAFVTTLGGNTTRGAWAVNTLATPLLFVVQSGTLYSINNAGVTSSIGTIGTMSGDVSMADDGTFLVLVDGTTGYTYNMITPAGLNAIVDANFTTSPKYVTWQDTYFVVTSGLTNQFQLSKNADPTTWPAVNISTTGSRPGALQAGFADHSVLNLFGQDYAEFWQDAGSPDFPYTVIPGSAQTFGLASAWSLVSYDNSIVGLFKNKENARLVARMSGFNLKKISDHDIDQILAGYSTVSDARGGAFSVSGHPLYLLNLPTAGASWAFDGLANAWSEWQATDGTRFWGDKFALFQNRLCVSDRRNGNIYQFDATNYTDNGSAIPREVWSKHIWKDDKYLGIERVQIDVESGVGVATGQGVNPVLDLQVSKDGGNTFMSVGFASVGAIGAYTQRVIWRSLGAARDWVLKLRITDPVKFVIVSATAEVSGAAF
jgi:hypothetical protein